MAVGIYFANQLLQWFSGSWKENGMDIKEDGGTFISAICRSATSGVYLVHPKDFEHL